MMIEKLSQEAKILGIQDTISSSSDLHCKSLARVLKDHQISMRARFYGDLRRTLGVINARLYRTLQILLITTL